MVILFYGNVFSETQMRIQFGTCIDQVFYAFRMCFLWGHQTGVHHALNPDPYRGMFGSDGEKYARDVQDLIDFGTSGHVAGFISEAIQVSAMNFNLCFPRFYYFAGLILLE